MRSLSALSAVLVLSLGILACGGASKTNGTVSSASTSSTASEATATTRRPKEENDNDDHTDPPAPADDPNNEIVREYGQAPSAGEKRVITRLIRRYYAAALVGDGARACTMLDPNLVPSMPVAYGRYGLPYMRGAKSCIEIMSRLFRHEHALLRAEVPRLELLAVRVKGNNGQILLGFGKLSERQITTIRRGGVWKVAVILDGEVE